MPSIKISGRIIGVLLLVHLAGLIVPFVLLLPLTRDPQEYLANAAGASLQIKIAVFLLLFNCALTIGISLAAWAVFRPHSEAQALLLVALSVILFSLQAVDNAHIMSMLSLSQRYTESGGPVELFQALAAMAGFTRRWVHLSVLLVIDAWLLVLFLSLYRFALAPRLLSAFGILTVLLHFTAITLPLWLGYSPLTLLGATMGVSQLAVSVWLMFKGFAERPSPLVPVQL